MKLQMNNTPTMFDSKGRALPVYAHTLANRVVYSNSPKPPDKSILMLAANPHRSQGKAKAAMRAATTRRNRMKAWWKAFWTASTSMAGPATIILAG